MARMLKIPVSEIMSRDLLIVRPEDTVKRVSDIFHSNNIHHIPVVEKDGKLVGMISKSDFLKVNHMLALFNEQKYGALNQKLYEALRVNEIMTPHVATLSPEDPITIAADIFKENLFHCLPVVENGILTGVVTTQDLINYCFSTEAFLE